MEGRRKGEDGRNLPSFKIQAADKAVFMGLYKLDFFLFSSILLTYNDN